jgi:hypothetical protein
MSLRTADGHVEILRPSRQAELPWPGSDDLSESIARRQQYEQQAIRVAKVTASQKRLADTMDKFKAKGLAKRIVGAQKDPEQLKRNGVKGLEHAGQHIGKSVEKGASQFLGTVDKFAGELAGDPNAGKAGHTSKLQVKLPPSLGRVVVGALKKEFS